MKPRCLDLFCGAGGASMGLHRAGFDVTGVDINPQPRYPFTFIQADAMTFPLEGYDFIWASPPCQGYSRARNNGMVKAAPMLVGEVRARLERSGMPWVIENVPGAPLRFAVELCGASFGLKVSGFDLSRHRIFECSVMLLVPACCHRRGRTIGVYGNGTNAWHRKKFGRNITEGEKREAMDISWMSRRELTQAIPPAYSEFIGRRILSSISPTQESI